MSVNRSPVSVVIPVYNGASVIGKQIRALAPQLFEADELIVVDNLSTDGTRAVLDGLSTDVPGLKVVEASDRPGVNYARNTGILASRRPNILLCDADDEVSPGWVAAMVAALEHFDIVGGVSNLISSMAGDVTEKRTLGSIFRYLPYALGGNLGVRRVVIEGVGGFDEAFVGGHDEVDFCWRAQRAGFTLGLAEGAMINYVQRPTVAAVTRQYCNSGRTSILLWVRHQDELPGGQVSLSGALRHVLRGLPTGFRLALKRATESDARGWGWAVGVLEGHVLYRILRRVPPARIPAAGADSHGRY